MTLQGRWHIGRVTVGPGDKAIGLVLLSLDETILHRLDFSTADLCLLSFLGVEVEQVEIDSAGPLSTFRCRNASDQVFSEVRGQLSQAVEQVSPGDFTETYDAAAWDRSVIQFDVAHNSKSPEIGETTTVSGADVVQGSEALISRYGYWPSLHDGRIDEIDLDPGEGRLAMSIHYYDAPENEDGDLATQIRLTFQGVQSLDFRLRFFDIYNCDWSRRVDGAGFMCEMVDNGTGLTKRILFASATAEISEHRSKVQRVAVRWG